MVSWFNPNIKLINNTSDDRVTVLPVEYVGSSTFESVLIFYPVDNGDEGPFDDQGEYTCEMNISSTDNFILNGVNNITKHITVEGIQAINNNNDNNNNNNINNNNNNNDNDNDNNDNNNDDNNSADIEKYDCLSSFLEMPPIEMNISTSGDTQVGQSFNMTCSVRVVKGLVQQPNVTWMKMDDVSMGDLNELNISSITVIDGSVTNVTVILDPVLFEHRGVYTCMAEFNITLTNDADSDSQEYILIVDCKL